MGADSPENEHRCYKVRKGGPDGRGVGFYFRNVTELLLFGTRGKLRTLTPDLKGGEVVRLA